MSAMRLGTLALAATLLAPTFAAPLTSSAATAIERGSLPHGGTYAVSSDPTIAAAAVDLWFRAPSNGYDAATPGIARLAASAVAASKLESGKTLVQFVRDLGGRIQIEAFPDILGVSIVVPSSAARQVVSALTSAYFAPTIDDDALKLAVRDNAFVVAEDQYDADTVVHDALFAQIFSGGPNHVAPEPTSIAAIASIARSNVEAFAKRAFRSNNAILTLAGNVSETMTAAVTAGMPGTPDAPIDSTQAADPQPSSTVSGAVAGNGIAWAGPPIADARSATALDFIADYLFGDPAGTITKSLSDAANSYAEGQFITLHGAGVMLVTYGGDASDATAASIHKAIVGMQKPMSSEAFAAAKAAFLFHLALDGQSPAEQADSLGWYAAEGDASYAPAEFGGTYDTLAQGLDAAFVASVAQRYLAHPVVVHVHETDVKGTSS